jgi:polyisoprenoid-binding protein YceI
LIEEPFDFSLVLGGPVSQIFRRSHLAALSSVCQAQAPVFEITPINSWIKFDVKASVDIAGKFDKWDATLAFTSPDQTTGVLEIKIQADSVDTGSG